VISNHNRSGRAADPQKLGEAHKTQQRVEKTSPKSLIYNVPKISILFGAEIQFSQQFKLHTLLCGASSLKLKTISARVNRVPVAARYGFRFSAACAGKIAIIADNVRLSAPALCPQNYGSLRNLICRGGLLLVGCA